MFGCYLVKSHSCFESHRWEIPHTNSSPRWAPCAITLHVFSAWIIFFRLFLIFYKWHAFPLKSHSVLNMNVNIQSTSCGHAKFRRNRNGTVRSRSGGSRGPHRPDHWGEGRSLSSYGRLSGSPPCTPRPKRRIWPLVEHQIQVKPCGFRYGCGTQDQLYTLRRLLELANS